MRHYSGFAAEPEKSFWGIYMEYFETYHMLVVAQLESFTDSKG
tara:strand:+ start:55 stop:183 length:129 start_codon:yes stop_codon:yes gene_type:complete